MIEEGEPLSEVKNQTPKVAKAEKKKAGFQVLQPKDVNWRDGSEQGLVSCSKLLSR